MPELPEVETVVRTVEPHLRGRRILSAQFTSRLVTPGNRAALARRLEGRTVESVRRRGKFIVVRLDQGLFTIHLGMTGRLSIGGKPPEHIHSEHTHSGHIHSEHTHGVFHLDDGVLLYDDPRQFGKIEWNPARVARLGPEPLEITLEEFRARLKRKARIKPLLLNQAFLAGMGNIYVDESLFAAGIHPLASAAQISAARAAKLHQAIREILSAAIAAGGSSISDYVDAEGRRGWFQVSHQAYGREGEACSRCGSPIRKIVVGQRGTHYCPRCQKK